MNNGESVFQFDLRESVYFEDHQQVSEITGISLEPEISIQTYGDYISIRGVIALHGEYRSVDNSVVEQMQPSFEKQALRYIDSVEADENGFAMFSHQFPVEISVPLYRIADLNDVAVNIESFDYTLPDPAQLVVTADIAIHGISNSERSPDSGGDTEQETEEWDSFSVELKKEKESSESTTAEMGERVNEGLTAHSEHVNDGESSTYEESIESYSTERVSSEYEASIESYSSEREEPFEQTEFVTENESLPEEQTEATENKDTTSFEETKESKESSDGRWKWTKSQSFDEFFW
ncbi:stage VI sporulation protein D [Virgibacillus halophilus]|uniref:Stage VI sporulation protein D n=1 Tax=Tigheibacillus halophilus TaxID=361280 RepID=A0ABU5CC17_9BACI|nr:stage VI sporulation protein D [Virgibacillus halophilus]